MEGLIQSNNSERGGRWVRPRGEGEKKKGGIWGGGRGSETYHGLPLPNNQIYHLVVLFNYNIVLFNYTILHLDKRASLLARPTSVLQKGRGRTGPRKYTTDTRTHPSVLLSA